MSEMPREHFDRDVAIQRRIESFEDDSHPAETNYSSDFMRLYSSQHLRIDGWSQQFKESRDAISLILSANQCSGNRVACPVQFLQRRFDLVPPVRAANRFVDSVTDNLSESSCPDKI